RRARRGKAAKNAHRRRGGAGEEGEQRDQEHHVQDAAPRAGVRRGVLEAAMAGPSAGSGGHDFLPPDSACSRGRVSRNSLPAPGREWASIVPPCAATSFFEIASPRPVPCDFEV